MAERMQKLLLVVEDTALERELASIFSQYEVFAAATRAQAMISSVEL